MSIGNSVPLEPKDMVGSIAIGVLLAVLLASCSPGQDGAPPVVELSSPAPAQIAEDTVMPGTASPAPANAGGTVGGDGSLIQLEVLTEADLADASLEGELGCSFSADGQRPLLYAMGIVGSDTPAQGVVKVASYVEPIRAPGGFNGMISNPTFTGQGKTILIKEAGEAIGGGESPPRPATLTYQRADGASRTFAGRWQCGP